MRLTKFSVLALLPLPTLGPDFASSGKDPPRIVYYHNLLASRDSCRKACAVKKNKKFSTFYKIYNPLMELTNTIMRFSLLTSYLNQFPYSCPMDTLNISIEMYLLESLARRPAAGFAMVLVSAYSILSLLSLDCYTYLVRWVGEQHIFT